MSRVVTKVGEGGRIVIPVEFRRALGVETGDEIMLELEEGALRMLTPKEAIRRAQALVRQYVPEGVSLVDELIAERRREAEREERE